MKRAETTKPCNVALPPLHLSIRKEKKNSLEKSDRRLYTNLLFHSGRKRSRRTRSLSGRGKRRSGGGEGKGKGGRKAGHGCKFGFNFGKRGNEVSIFNFNDAVAGRFYELRTCTYMYTCMDCAAYQGMQAFGSPARAAASKRLTAGAY